MSSFSVKDNCKIEKTKFSEIHSLTDKIADKTLDQLKEESIFVFPELNDSDDLVKDQMILQSDKGFYRTSNVMGFIGYDHDNKKERLIINSRFSTDGNYEDFFLRYMLSKVVDPNIVELATNADTDEQLFDYLVFLFPFMLKNAMRKGIYKEYVCKQYNDFNVKGTIDIPRQIKTNTPFTGKIAYSQREFSYDNNLMELIRHTIEFIKYRKYANSLLSKVKDEVNQISEITRNYSLSDRQRIISANIRKPIQHAFYSEYRNLQKLCILILQRRKHQIGFGTDKIYGILFDGAWLWEEYVNSLITLKFHHPRNKGGSGAQRLFSHGEKGKIGLIYPDFISIDVNDRIIADAKYKPMDNIGNKDYLQVLAYMYRFDSRKGFYLYPESDGNMSESFHLLKGSTYEKVEKREKDADIVIRKIGLMIPGNVKTFDDFRNIMEDSEKLFKTKLGVIDE